jgi:hypothetical protein
MDKRASLVAAGLLLAACAGPGLDPDQVWGMGAGVGDSVGYGLAGHLGIAARKAWADATMQAAEAARPNQAVHWQAGEHQGTVTMTAAGWSDDGKRSCLPLRQDVQRIADGASFSRDVVACRISEGGTWEVRDPTRD